MSINPKIVLDEEILSKLNQHYSAHLGEDVLGRECFSDPKMESHFCNPQASVEGEKPCESCGSVPGRPCAITCDISHFCLAAYAVRLGIGSAPRKKVETSIKENLKKKYSTLYNLILKQREAFEEASKTETDPPPPKDETQLELPVVDFVAEVKAKRPKSDEPVLDAEGFQLISVKDAAKVYGCTYVNLYSHIQKGRLRRIKCEFGNYVRKADVEALRDKKMRPGKVPGKKKGEEK